MSLPTKCSWGLSNHSNYKLQVSSRAQVERMQLNQLLMSMAAPAVAKSTQFAVSTAQAAGQGFLKALREAAPKRDRSSPPADQNQFGQKLQSWGQDFQRFLEQRGVVGDYTLRLELSSDGDLSAGTAGPRGTEVANVLQQYPAWLEQLSGLAFQGQRGHTADPNQRPPHLQMQLTPHGSSHWYFR